VTTGEPAGIGPDLAIAAALRDWPCELVFAGDPALLSARARELKLGIEPSEWRPDTAPMPHRAGTLPMAAVTLATQVVAGRLDVANARYVLEMLDLAIDGCIAGQFTAMVTGPVQKSAINDAGIDFTGHTEYLAARCGVPLPVMLLVAGRLRVALATTHLALSTPRSTCSTTGSGLASACPNRGSWSAD
jgi:4-hydroxythreonine-4-phosphate dehydrogenase